MRILNKHDFDCPKECGCVVDNDECTESFSDRCLTVLLRQREKNRKVFCKDDFVAWCWTIMLIMCFCAVHEARCSISDATTAVHRVDIVAGSNANVAGCVSDSSLDVNGICGEQQDSGPSGCLGLLQKFWKWIVGCLVVLLGVSVKYKHAIDWVLKVLDMLGIKRSKSAASSTSVSATVGNITNTGSGTVVNNINIMPSVEKSREAPVDQASCVDKCDSVPRTSKSFVPFRQPLFGKTLEVRIMRELQTVETLHSICDKDKIRICVIDDRDSRNCMEGLSLLGYKSVTPYKKCPSFDELRTYAIAFFDIKGIRNQAGDDGLSLAEAFKRMYPTRMVIVRSGVISEEQKKEIEARGTVDFVLVKDRDFGKQVGPILQRSGVGDPGSLWKMVRIKLLEKKPLSEVAVMEHKYVSAINLLSDEGKRLPGDWLTTVNGLLGGDIF